VIYKIIVDPISQQPNAAMRFNEDGTVSSFVFDPANTDYQQYLAWLAEGNEPLPAPEPEPIPEPTAAEKLAASGLTVKELKGLLGLD
jgi:hypothetical protein